MKASRSWKSLGVKKDPSLRSAPPRGISAPILLVLVLCCALSTCTSRTFDYPSTRAETFQEEHFGHPIKDPYRRLEEDTPERRQWIQAQDDFTLNFTRQIGAWDSIRQRIEALARYETINLPVKSGNRYFFATMQGRNMQVLFQQPEGESRKKLFDPAELSPNPVLRSFVPDPAGERVALILGSGAGRWSEVRVIETVDGRFLDTRLQGIHQTASSVAWLPDGTGFYYVRFELPSQAERDQAPVRNPRLFLHTLGKPQDQDRLILDPQGQGVPFAQVTHDGAHLVVSLRQGTLIEEIWTSRVGENPSRWIHLPGSSLNFLGLVEGRYFFQTDHQAPRGRVVSVSPDRPRPEDWQDVIPEGEEALAGSSWGQGMILAGGRLVGLYRRHTRPFVRVFDFNGELETEIEFPDFGDVWGGLSGSPDDAELLFSYLSLGSPRTTYRTNLNSGTTEIFFKPDVPIQPEDLLVEQSFYTASDGTRIPILLCRHRNSDTDRPRPLILYGYGAFEWVAFPFYQPQILAWLEMGGLYAIPGIRGGGEYGKSWHLAGSGRNKSRAIEDYIDAARWLIEEGLTSSDLLAANGGSASGVVAAAAGIRHPDLFGAVIADIPVLDMLRYDRFTAASSWHSEFGSPSDPQDFETLLSYSPYHNLEEGICYPPFLIMVGEKDQTAVPLHGYKLAAALQNTPICGGPSLLKVMWGSGHETGRTPKEHATHWTDALAFLLRVLDLKMEEGKLVF